MLGMPIRAKRGFFRQMDGLDIRGVYVRGARAHMSVHLCVRVHLCVLAFGEMIIPT